MAATAMTCQGGLQGKNRIPIVGGMTNGSSARQARLSEALRANLRRRKIQARARPDEPGRREAGNESEPPADSNSV